MLKVLYAGSPEAASVTLEKLILNSSSGEYEIAGVLTNPPSMQGRHKTPVQTPVCSIAQKYNIPVFSPEHLDSEVRAEIQKLSPDILVCFAYGHIFGPKFMSLFRFGGINLHPSKLPEYRGCTPVNQAILDLKDETAFSIQKVSPKMDEGNILVQEVIPLTKKETSESLLNDASLWGAEKITELLKKISKENAIPEGDAQCGEVSYTGIIKKEDAKIDWNKSAFEIDGIVRGYYADPMAWTTENGNTLKILEAAPLTVEEAVSISVDVNSNDENGKVVSFVKSKGIIVRCREGFVALTKLQRQGKNAMDYKSFMNGARDFVGSVLGK